MSNRPHSKSGSWLDVARRALDSAVRFVLPPICVSCSQVGAVFCGECQKKLTWFSDPLCPVCGRRLPAAGATCSRCWRQADTLQEIRAVFAFEGIAREAIHAFKYEGAFRVAEPLGALMARRYAGWARHCDIVIPIPLHAERVRERGYNQATLLAQHLCRQLDLDYDEEALWRTRYTQPQVGLTRAQRRENVMGAFSAGAQVAGKRVLLIDDVCTTGATLSAAADALVAEGATGVRGYCFARPAALGDG